MHFSRRKPLRTNSAFNPSLRKGDHDYNVVSAAYYEAPLPPAGGYPTPNGIGNSGQWSFTELDQGNGVRILSLKFNGQQVHTFHATDL